MSRFKHIVKGISPDATEYVRGSCGWTTGRPTLYSQNEAERIAKEICLDYNAYGWIAYAERVK